MFRTVSPTQASRDNASDLNGACFHCGEPCPEDEHVLDGKPFCCLGCQTVFSLLRENGLEQFYQLQAAPGTRVQVASAAAKWTFLDDPQVQEQLFDYADQTQAKVTLQLPAIHCVACVWLLENLFKLHSGIGHSLVNFSRREATISFAPERIKFSELAALLSSIGYEPQFTLAETEKRQKSPLRSRTWLQIGVAAFGFGNIMLLALPFYFGLDSLNGPWFRVFAGWLGLALALPVVTFSAADFWRAAWLSLRQRQLTLEVPIALGLAALYAASVIDVLLQRGSGYCDSLTGLIFFLLCGRVFQKKTYDRLTFDRDYKGFFPLSVIRKTPTGEETVAISRLEVGDKLVLRNGELLPADARVLSGEARMDYSFVTGESEPEEYPVGAHLYAGGRQTRGALEVETLKPVAQSYLASLWSNEAFRKNRENDLNSQTNRYSRYFTWLVISIAVGAGAFWMFQDAGKALKVFTSILIVACPCALALAAPFTHGTAQRILARLKIFLKNALVIERMTEVDTIVLDKTGTLTAADSRGVAFQGAALTNEEQSWIASLARQSTHPNSIRIARSLAGEPLIVSRFQETPGCGIEGEVSGHKIVLGAPAFVAADVCGDVGEIGHGEVCLAIDCKMRGAFKLENALRPEVEQMVSQLGSRFELALLSGDNDREAERFEKILGGRATLCFHQSPADKLEFIRKLQNTGRRVMMVGDGLNDAGALQQADVGVAVVEQTGVFSPASDVILDAAALPRLAVMLRFSRQAALAVRAGLAISAAYNIIGISIAAAGLLSPMVCAILMPLSSATVTVFSCGMTAWLGRQFQPGKNSGPMASRNRRSDSTFNLKPVAKEAA